MKLSAVRRPSSAQLKALGALFILFAFGGWALASPVGASPDENFHIASIWCSHGTRAGICEPGATADTRAVPAQFPLGIVCYAGKPTVSAACQHDQPGAGELASTGRGNFTGEYPPVFYYVAGFFVSHDVGASVVAMRLLNALLFVALFVAVYLLVAPGLRRAMIAGALVTAVPLGLFLVPSVNPSSWAILSAGTLLVSVLGYLTTPDRRRRLWLGGLAALSLLIGAGARSDAAMYAVVAVAAAIILTARRNRDTLRRLIYPAVLAVIAGLAFLTAGQSGSADPALSAGRAFSIGRFVRTALDVPALWLGASGEWSLGWFDTVVPAVVWVSGWGVFVAVVFRALDGAGWRRGLAAALVASAAWLIPTYILYVQNLTEGQFVQPRYILPLLTMLAVAAMVRLDGTAFRLGSVQRWIVVVVLALGNALSLFNNIRRYVTGIDVVSWNLNSKVEWWWPIPFGPMTVWALTVLAFTAGVVILTRELTTREPAAAEPGEAPATPWVPHVDRASTGDDEADLVAQTSAVGQT